MKPAYCIGVPPEGEAVSLPEATVPLSDTT